MAFPFFIQHLDASVKEFRLFLIIDEISVVKLDSICPGIARDLLEFEVMLGDWQPVFFLGVSGRHENRENNG